MDVRVGQPHESAIFTLWELKEVKEYINASVGWVNEWFET